MKQRTAAGTSATKLVVLAKETVEAYHHQPQSQWILS